MEGLSLEGRNKIGASGKDLFGSPNRNCFKQLPCLFSGGTKVPMDKGIGCLFIDDNCTVLVFNFFSCRKGMFVNLKWIAVGTHQVLSVLIT